MLVTLNSAVLTRVRPQGSQPCSVPRISDRPLAKVRPTATGAKARSTTARQAACAARCQYRATRCAARQDGANIAAKDTAAPAKPAAFRPISTTIKDPGPGAAREIANMQRNSLAVSQWC